MKIQILFVVLSIIGIALSIPTNSTSSDDEQVGNIPCKWTLFKQCNSSWGSDQLGTSSTQTICSAGCAMSSVAMALNSHHIMINKNTATNPETLNKWLTNNGGYSNGDLIIWSSVEALGGVTLYAYKTQSEETPSKIQGYLQDCYGIVANVRDGSHWVLLTGWEENYPNTFYVNDPGFSTTTYNWSDMLKFAIYKFTS